MIALLLALAGAPADTAGYRDRIRATTSPYLDQRVASAEGYRPLGPDAPGMGQHWINARTLLGSRFDPWRPAVLTYTSIAGHPTLVGVAYAVPLEPGMEPPSEPASTEAWHFHGGDIEEEALAIVHDRAHVGHIEGPVVAVLHAWVWVENPAGLFEAENWSLPWLRAGLAPPGTPRPAAARALSLADGGGAFFLGQAVRFGKLSDEDAARLRGILARRAAEVSGWLRQRQPGTDVGDSELAWLDTVWDQLWDEADAVMPPGLAGRFRVRP